MCQDDPNFFGKFGEKCDEWKGYDCMASRSYWRHTPLEERVLLESCPRSCHRCPDNKIEVKPVTCIKRL